MPIFKENIFLKQDTQIWIIKLPLYRDGTPTEELLVMMMIISSPHTSAREIVFMSCDMKQLA